MERLNKMNNKKNSTIELLRFVFLTCIIFLHCNHLGPDIVRMPNRLCPRGAFGVEFFFIVSGILMAKSTFGKTFCVDDVGSCTSKFVIRKWVRFVPYMIISVILTLLVEIFVAKRYGCAKAMGVFIQSLGDVFLLHMSGLNILQINGPIWYVSAMLLAMMILYPLLIWNRKLFIHVIAPLLSIGIIGWMLNFYHGITAHAGEWSGVVRVGVLRAIAEISLGCVAFEISQYVYSKYGKNICERILLIMIELIGYVLSIWWILFALQFPRAFECYVIFALAASLVVSFSGKGIILPVYLNSIAYWLGSLTLIMYFNHNWIISLVKYLSAPCRTYELYVRTSVIAFISVVVFAIVYNMILSVGSKILKKDSLNLNLTKGI